LFGEAVFEKIRRKLSFKKLTFQELISAGMRCLLQNKSCAAHNNNNRTIFDTKEIGNKKIKKTTV